MAHSKISDSAKNISSLPELSTLSTSFQYSSSERLFALNLQDFFKNLKQNILSSYTSDELVRLAHEAKAFSFLTSHISLAKQISTIGNSPSKFHQYCSPENFKNTSELSALALRITSQLHDYCHWKFLQINSATKELTSQDISYLEEYMIYFLRSENKAIFIKFLTSLSKRPSVHSTISEIISKYYINQNAFPQSFVVDNIKISPELQTYIQGKGLSDEDAKNYYTTEFNNIYNSFKSATKNKDWEQAKSSSDQLISYFSQNKNYISASRAWNILLSVGPTISINFKEKALAIFEFSLKIAETPEQKLESQFQILWLNILQKRFDLAKNTIEKYNFIDRFSSLDPKLQFWTAYCIRKSGEKYLARHLFSQLVQSSPLEYYTVTALDELAELGFPVTKDNLINKIKTRPPEHGLSFSDYSSLFFNAMKRIAIWSDLANEQLAYLEIKDVMELDGDKLFANKEVAQALSESEQKKIITMNLSVLLTSKKQFLQTFKVIYKSLSNNIFAINDQVVRMLFPFQYLSQIKKLGSEINPVVILSLIRQESAFNPRAQSMVGARGLMQLMPTTARQMKRSVTENQLINNPELNLQLGVKYLKHLLNKYDGNLTYTLAAYNAGEHRLRGWIENIFKDYDSLVTVELIPFQETQQYVKLIYRNMFFYNLLNAVENGEKSDLSQANSTMKMSLNGK